MAFKKFTDLNFDELERIAREKQTSGDRNEMNTLLEKNGQKLRNLVRKLKIDFIDPAGEDRIPEEAIRFCLRIRNGNADEEFYVKTLVNMYESLEKFIVLEPVPVLEAWDCSCGHHNLPGVNFCAKCGKPKGQQEPEPEGWDCSCGHHNPESANFCASCGEAKPPIVEEWICSQGHHNPKSANFCASCGETKPREVEEGWICLQGHHNPESVNFCPVCGEKRN